MWLSSIGKGLLNPESEVAESLGIVVEYSQRVTNPPHHHQRVYLSQRDRNNSPQPVRTRLCIWVFQPRPLLDYPASVDNAPRRAPSANMSLANCRFYEEKFPEIDSFVMVNVKQVRKLAGL